MARRGWLGLPLVQPFAGRAAAPSQALVLSGGGSKASFQIGALRYLYEVEGIAPTTMVGTSAGSILTAMLAQSGDPAEQAEGVRTLETLWRGMTRQSDMFTERSWFSVLRGRAPEVLGLVQADATPKRRLPRIPMPFTQGASVETGKDEPEPEVDESADLTPEQRTLALATADPDIDPPAMSPTQMMQVLSGLGRMRGLGTDVSTILAGADRTRSMYVPGPILRELLGGDLFSAQKVASSGIRTRIAMVGLETGGLYFMREDGHLVDRDDVEQPGGPWEFSQGCLASCSIPAVFAPVLMGDQHFVDGGVRENLPAEMAMGVLGCDRTYVVTSNASGVELAGSFAEKDIFSIMMRAEEIQSDESERDEAAYAKTAGAVFIEPEIHVHDALTVDPGLIAINIDYGWMRAAEVHLGCTRAEQDLTRSIIQARRRIWELEKDFLDEGVPHDERDVLLLARLKYDLREQVPRVRAAVLPEGADHWWQEWEGHQTKPDVPRPWLV